jgi:cytochrome c oxidase subunit 3
MRQAQLERELRRPQRMDTNKFMLWLIMASVAMIFAALTSAYIVKRSEGGWDSFQIPTLFFISTLVILASSATMHWALLSARRDELGQLKIAISITAVLGVAFMVLQFVGYFELNAISVYMTGSNVSGSFFVIIAGAHWTHIIAGVIFLLVVFVRTYQFKVHAKSLNLIEMCAVFWHFLDGLWLYLFLFMLVLR